MGNQYYLMHKNIRCSMAELDNILGDILNYEDYSTGVSPLNPQNQFLGKTKNSEH